MLHEQQIADAAFRFAFEHVQKLRNWMLQANDLRAETALTKALADSLANRTLEAIGVGKKAHPWIRNDAVAKKRGRPPKEKINLDNGHGVP